MKLYITLEELDSLISSKYLFLPSDRKEVVQQAHGSYVIVVQCFKELLMTSDFQILLLENVSELEVPQVEYQHVFSNISIPKGKIKLSKRQTSRDRGLNQISVFDTQPVVQMDSRFYVRFRRGLKCLVDGQIIERFGESDNIDLSGMSIKAFIENKAVIDFISKVVAKDSIPEYPRPGDIPNLVSDRARWWVNQLKEFVEQGMYPRENLMVAVESFKTGDYSIKRGWTSGVDDNIQNMLIGYYLFAVNSKLGISDEDEGVEFSPNKGEYRWQVFFSGLFDEKFDNKYYVKSINLVQLELLEYVFQELMEQRFTVLSSGITSVRKIAKSQILQEHFELKSGLSKPTLIIDKEKAFNHLNWLMPEAFEGLIMPVDSLNNNHYKGSKWYRHRDSVIVQESTLVKERFVIPNDENELSIIAKTKGWTGKKLSSFFNGYRFGIVVIKEGVIPDFVRAFSYWMSLTEHKVSNVLVLNLVTDIEVLSGITRDIVRQDIEEELRRLFPNSNVDLFFKSAHSSEREVIRVLENPIMSYGLKKTLLVSDRRNKMVDDWVIKSTNEFIVDGQIESRFCV